MSVHHTLFCFLFLSLQAGNSSSVNGLDHFYKFIGEDITVMSTFTPSATWKFFCRESCEGENKLIQTGQTTAQRGRYRINYSYKTSVLFVSIEHLTTSDSGRYRCGLGRSSSSPSSYRDFKLVVADALLYGTKEEPFYREAGSSLTVGCSFNFDGSTKYFCRGECEEKILVQTDGDRAQSDRYRIEYVDATLGGVLYVTITQLTPSDSGRYRCYLDRTGFVDGSTDFTITVTDASTPSTVVTAASTPSTTQSFSSRSGSSTPSASSEAADPSVPPQHEGTTSTDVLLIVGLTLVFTVILFSLALLVFCRRRSSKPLKGLCEQTVHETVTEAEANLHQPLYAQVDFSNSNSDSPVRGSSGISDDVVYSVPRVDVSSKASRDVDESLYSNVR